MVGPVAAPSVSVLMPTNGSASTIGPAIESVLAQNYGDFEFLVVGDGCDAETEHVIARYSDPRLRYLAFPKEAGSGLDNRNAALEHLGGDMVAFAQHDDLWFHDHLTQLRRSLARPGIAWAYSRPAWINAAAHILPFFVNLRVPAHRRSFLEERNLIPSNCVAARRDVLAAAGYFNPQNENSGDWGLWKRVIAAHGPGCIGVVREVTSLHFRAVWKEKRTWGPAPLSHLEALAERSGAWPPQLRLEQFAGSGVLQPSVWGVMSGPGGVNLVGRIRTGVQMLEDMLSWTASYDPMTRTH